MAIYHNSSKIIGRSQGRSAVGASAYRSGEKLHNEYDGIEHDYTKKTGVVYSEIMIPPQAKEEFKNREVLWNQVEKIEKSKDSQLAREVEVSLPKEFDRAEQIELIKSYVQDNFVKNGMCADINIHDKGDGNPHAHVMLTMREIKENGEWGAKQEKLYLLRKEGEKDIYVNSKIAKEKIQNEGYEKVKNGKGYKTKSVDLNNWNSKEFLQSYREDWANKINQKLMEKGINQRVDHRSFEEQGIEKKPTIHEGYVARAMEKRGELSDRMEQNRQIKDINEKIEKLNKDIKNLDDEKGGIELMEIREQIEKERAELEKLRTQKEEINKNLGQQDKEQTLENKEPIKEPIHKKADNNDNQELQFEISRLEAERNRLLELKAKLEKAYKESSDKFKEYDYKIDMNKDNIMKIEDLTRAVKKEKETKDNLKGFFKGKERKQCDEKIEKYENKIEELKGKLLDPQELKELKEKHSNLKDEVGRNQQGLSDCRIKLEINQYDIMEKENNLSDKTNNNIDKVDPVEQMFAKDEKALKAYKEMKSKGEFEVKAPKLDKSKDFGMER